MIFLIAHLDLIHFERELIYLSIASMFVYVRVITLFFKQYDPLMPFENLSSGLLFTSWTEIIVSDTDDDGDTSLMFVSVERLSTSNGVDECADATDQFLVHGVDADACHGGTDE